MGNVTEVRQSNTVVLATYAYAPFGTILTNTGSYVQPFRFQTKLAHGRSGLGYWGYRWYDTRTGQWITRDPLAEAEGLNLYQYCANNPVNSVDPYGLWAGWASGEPVSTGESLMPVWGSGRQAVNDFSAGNYVWGSINSVGAVSDIFLIKSAATMAGKGAWKSGSATWGATRKWLAKRRYAQTGQHVHHGVVAREVFEGTWSEKVFNQPWNLKPLEPRPGYSMDMWHKMVEGKLPGLNPAERWWFGTPDWLRYAEISGAGRIGDAFRGDDADECK